MARRDLRRALGELNGRKIEAKRPRVAWPCCGWRFWRWGCCCMRCISGKLDNVRGVCYKATGAARMTEGHDGTYLHAT